MKELDNKKKDEEEDKKWKELVEKVTLRKSGGHNLEQGVPMRSRALPNPNGSMVGQGARHPFIKPNSRCCQEGGPPVEESVSIDRRATPNHPKSATKRKRLSEQVEDIASPMKRRRELARIQQSDGTDMRKVVNRNGIIPKPKIEEQGGKTSGGQGGS